MKGKIITVDSPLTEKSRKLVQSLHRLVARSLRDEFEDGGIILKSKDIVKASSKTFCVVNIATGGTEKLIADLFSKGFVPLVLIAWNRLNSLPAALETRAYLRNISIPAMIVYASWGQRIPSERVLKEFSLASNLYLISRINILELGASADWLIASSVDKKIAQQRYKIQFNHIELDELQKEYENVDLAFSLNIIVHLSRRCTFNVEPEEVKKSLRLYFAIRNILEREGSRVFTISCFNVFKLLGVTPCLALSLLNSEGFVGGCEGDEQAVFTMHVFSRLSGRPVFMGNVANLDFEKNSLVLSHCTAPLGFPGSCVLKTHFETESSVGVNIALEKNTSVTLGRFNKHLDKLVLAFGRVLESNLSFSGLCRTQIEIKVEGSLKKFINYLPGNHVALAIGKIEDSIFKFADVYGVKVVQS